MDIRPLFRPWALVVLFLFVAVAVVDFVDSVRTVPEPLPRLLAPERLDFKGSDGDDGSDAIIIDYEKERLSIRRSGTVFIRFTMNDRVDALVLDYRYGGGGGEAAVGSRPHATERARNERWRERPPVVRGAPGRTYPYSASRSRG